MHSLALEPPSQNNTAAWARILVAARVVDKVQSDGVQEIDADSLTMAHLKTLLPIARTLYDEIVGPGALGESQMIGDILKYCGWFIHNARSSRRASTMREIDAAERWSEEECLDAARNLMFPRKIKTLRAVSPNGVGFSFIPNVPAWRLLQSAMWRTLSSADKRQAPAYRIRIYRGVCRHSFEWNEVQPLRSVRFVDEVRSRAPPLVGALPPQWSFPGTTDVMLEALLGLLNLGNTRSLTRLVKKLSNAEYDFLVRERKCLSQVLEWNALTLDCAIDRSLKDYLTFAHILRHDADFKGFLKVVPRRPKEAPASLDKVKDSSSSGPAQLDPFETLLLTKRPAVEHGGFEALRGWTVKRQRSDVGRGGTGNRQRSAADPLMLLAEAATDVEGAVALSHSAGLLARSNGAVAVSSVSVSLIAAAGAVAALGLVLFLVVRFRARRVTRG